MHRPPGGQSVSANLLNNRKELFILELSLECSKTKVRAKMKRIIAILAVLMLSGCYNEQYAIQQEQNRIQREQYYEKMGEYGKNLAKSAKAYRQCAGDYGRKNANLPLSSSDIAAEAVVSCKKELDNCSMYLWLKETGEHGTKRYVHLLIEEGKEETIRQVIKNRKK